MTNFRIHIVPSPRASSHFLGDQLSHSYSIISKGKLTLPWWPPSHSYHTISNGRTSSKTAGIDLELDFELDLVYNNFWATTLELEACHYWNNLPENIRVWGRHIISSSIYYCTKWDFKAPCLSFSLFSFPGYHRRTKIFLGSVIAWENTPETSVFPEVWVPSLCCYPGALTLGMALSLGIYPKLIGASQTWMFLLGEPWRVLVPRPSLSDSWVHSFKAELRDSNATTGDISHLI